MAYIHHEDISNRYKFNFRSKLGRIFFYYNDEGFKETLNKIKIESSKARANIKDMFNFIMECLRHKEEHLDGVLIAHNSWWVEAELPEGVTCSDIESIEDDLILRKNNCIKGRIKIENLIIESYIWGY